MEERQHARRSPSSFKYIKQCPGYLPEQKQELHPNTLRGIKVHAALESGNYAPLDDQELRWAEFCIGERNKLIIEYFPQGARFEELGELKVEVSRKHGCYGYTDALLVHADLGILIDWKFGWGKVDEAEENDQGKAYAVGVFKQFRKLKNVVVAFVQAPLRHVSTVVYFRADAKALRKDIEGFLKRGSECDNDPKALIKYCNPNPNYCEYCQRAKDLTCPYMSTALKTIETKIQGLTVPADFDPSNLPANPEDLVKIMRVQTIVKKIFDAASDKLKELLESGVQIDGVELQYAEGRSTIKNPKAAWTVAEGRGITKEEFENCLTVSLTDLKDLVKVKAPRGEKEHAVELLLALLSEADAITIAEPTKKLKLSKI